MKGQTDIVNTSLEENKISLKDKKEVDDMRNDVRPCPACNFPNIKGMPGGRDAVCKNCGFKDPCCT
jgi:hypothetical protein